MNTVKKIKSVSVAAVMAATLGFVFSVHAMDFSAMAGYFLLFMIALMAFNICRLFE